MGEERGGGNKQTNTAQCTNLEYKQINKCLSAPTSIERADWRHFFYVEAMGGGLDFLAVGGLDFLAVGNVRWAVV